MGGKTGYGGRRSLMVATVCWLGLSRSHSQSVAGDCKLLVGVRFRAGGTKGVQIWQGKVDTGVGWE